MEYVSRKAFRTCGCCFSFQSYESIRSFCLGPILIVSLGQTAIEQTPDDLFKADPHVVKAAPGEGPKLLEYTLKRKVSFEDSCVLREWCE